MGIFGPTKMSKKETIPPKKALNCPDLNLALEEIYPPLNFYPRDLQTFVF